MEKVAVDLILSGGALGLLYLAGTLLQQKVGLLRRFLIPAPIIGGFLGLIAGPRILSILPMSESLSSLVFPLVLVIFACVFIGRKTPKFRKLKEMVLPQFLFDSLLTWGQIFVSLVLVIFLIKLFWDIPAALGIVPLASFEGAIPLAYTLRDLFFHYNWAAGATIAIIMAVIGQLVGIVFGILLINWAVRKKHVKRADLNLKSVKEPPAKSLGFHLSLIGAVLIISYLLVASLPFVPSHMMALILVSVTIFVSYFFQKILKISKISKQVDRNTIHKIENTIMEFVVILLITLLPLDHMLANLIPILILTAGIVLWSTFCVMFLAKYFFNENWFERAIVDFGQSTGDISISLLLLSIVDPHRKTSTQETFMLKLAFHVPLTIAIGVPMLIFALKGYAFHILIGLAIVLPIIFFAGKKLAQKYKKE